MFSTYLLTASIIIISCVALNKVSNKLGIPMLLGFIVLGMLFGSDGVIKLHFDNFALAEQICSTALIFIMFYGGFGTKWSQAKPIAVKAILLSTVGVILTAGITALFCNLILGIGILESLLIGSIVSSTDAASVFSILRSRRLNLKYGTASLLELESGSNDPCSYMLCVIILSLMSQSATNTSVLYMIFAQIAYGILCGIVISLFAIFILKRFQFSTPGFDAIFIVSVALLSYSIPSTLGGNGYLSAYIVGIVLGNQPLKNKQSLVHFFDGATGLMQMLIFFLLGLLSFPSQLPTVFIPAMIIAFIITFIARPLSTLAILGPFRCPLNQQILVSLSGLRGAASIVFAIMATMNSTTLNNDIFHIVFCIVLFSILVQGSLIPFAARKLNMIDADSDVLKTFTDYTDEIPVQFIQFLVPENHLWCNQAIKDILLPPDTLLVLIQRNNENIYPNGDTMLLAGDMLVLSANAVKSTENIYLSEVVIDNDDEWINKHIYQIKMEPNKLIILIKRNNQIIIPNGDTVLQQNDVLVINKAK